MENPLYFKENQWNNINPHDSLRIKQSAAIIQHVPAGRGNDAQAGYAEEIGDIVRNHHGSGTVGYFYYEAQKEDPNVDVADFTYEEIRRETRQAIVMLADIVEAAVRSLDNPSREEISEMVHKLIKARLRRRQR